MLTKAHSACCFLQRPSALPCLGVLTVAHSACWPVSSVAVPITTPQQHSNCNHSTVFCLAPSLHLCTYRHWYGEIIKCGKKYQRWSTEAWKRGNFEMFPEYGCPSWQFLSLAPRCEIPWANKLQVAVHMSHRPRREPHFSPLICHISPPTDPICVIFIWKVRNSLHLNRGDWRRPGKGVLLKCELSMGAPAGNNQAQYPEVAAKSTWAWILPAGAKMSACLRREPYFSPPISHFSPPTDLICVIIVWIV